MKSLAVFYKSILRTFLQGILVISLFAACVAPVATTAPTAPAATALSTSTVVPSPSPTLQTTAAPAIWLSPLVPDALRASLTLPNGWQFAAQPEDALFRFDILAEEAPSSLSTAWVYALAAPFPTITDQISAEDLRSLWRGEPSDDLPVNHLLVDTQTLAVFSHQWGTAGTQVQSLPATELLSSAWDSKNTWAILPFEQLEPRWKVIAIDEQNPVQKAFDAEQYALTVHFGWLTDQQLVQQAGLSIPLGVPNRQSDHLTTVMLTGVTALVRGTASWMEYAGNDYPAMFIGDWLREADILHINNEVPFAKNCPIPYPWEGLVFCSRTKYIELLESIGTDVIDLSGDHFQDWGQEAMLLTIDMYKQRGWPYYGGGLNRADAQKPALFEHNGNKIAFLGCNAKPPGYAGADDDSPGALHCDFDELVGAIQQVRADGYLPIVTFQHLEYYSYDAHPILQADFRRVAEAGAVIVSGSQAHQPHAINILDQADMQTADNNPPALSFLHYGLGNLFFDQFYEGYPTRQAFIDRHVIYEGRHISTELLTILFIDLARARPMTLEERQDLLSTIFKASGW